MSSKDYGTLEDGKNWWEKKVVSEDERMRMNGETKAQMEFAEELRKAGGVSLKTPGNTDTSVDQEWTYEDKPYTDGYVLITTAIWMLPKLIVFLPTVLILSFIPLALIHFYMGMMPEPMERVPRNALFYAWFAVAFILFIPAMLVIVISYLLDSIVYYIFSILFCTCTWQWGQAMNNFELIRPFRGGPSILAHSTDIMCCIMGQSMRQGFLEIIYMVSMMWVLIPWLKYYICCNPFIYNLDHRLVQQISTGMADLKEFCSGVDEIADECRHVISRARNSRSRRHRIDLWSFVPHYPFPPPGRRHAFGMQAGGASYPAKFTLLVNVTHADIKAQGSQEQLVLSNSIERPCYRVMLWYSNPFHFLTGWVEASISTGKPSQPQKNLGGEHPMWLVSGKTFLTSNRESYTGSGMIDWFFDYWLPVFVHEIRYSIKYKSLLNDKSKYGEEVHKKAQEELEEAWNAEAKAKENLTTAGDDEEKKKAAEAVLDAATKEVEAKTEAKDKTRWRAAQEIAREYADSKYQQVKSKDGMSEAIDKEGLDQYPDDGDDAATLKIYRKQGVADQKETAQKFDDCIGDWNKSCCVRKDDEISWLLAADWKEDYDEGNPRVYPEKKEGFLLEPAMKKHWVRGGRASLSKPNPE